MRLALSIFFCFQADNTYRGLHVSVVRDSNTCVARGTYVLGVWNGTEHFSVAVKF
jgi:DUF1365 family protein